MYFIVSINEYTRLKTGALKIITFMETQHGNAKACRELPFIVAGNFLSLKACKEWDFDHQE